MPRAVRQPPLRSARTQHLFRVPWRHWKDLHEMTPKQRKTATELEELVRQRIGSGDFEVTIHRNPEVGWHATIYGRQPAEVHRCQVMADTIAAELCQHYELGIQRGPSRHSKC
jgi:hypothetical protein